jgi:hypothetical protein
MDFSLALSSLDYRDADAVIPTVERLKELALRSRTVASSWRCKWMS